MTSSFKLTCVAFALLTLAFTAQAQTNSVSIGTSSTNTSAVLWLNSPSGNQGLIIPVGNRANVVSPVKGMLIFDTNQVYFYDGTNWNSVGGGGNGLPTPGANQILTSSGSSLPAWVSTIPGSQVTPAFGAQAISTTGTLSSGATTVTGLTVSGATTSLNNKSYTWPNNPTLTSGTFLQTDATGNLSWATPPGSLPTAGANQILTSNNASAPTWATSIAGSQVNPTFGSQPISTTGTLSSGATTVTGLTVSGAATKLNGLTYFWPLTLTSGNYLQTDVAGNLTWAPVSVTELDPVVKAINGIVKSNGTTISAATSGTDYAPATSGSSILKGNSAGGFSNAATADFNTSFGSQTAKFFYAAPNGAAGNPSFRGILASDIPTLNQNTTGSAGSVANALTVDNSSIQLSSGTTYNGSSASTISVKASGITNAMLAGSIASSKLIGTDIATVGTITAGKWNGTAIGEAFGGTNQTSYAAGDILYASTPSTLSKLAIGSPGQVLTINAGGTAPFWAASSSSGWGLTGNSLSGTEFIGSTNAQDFIFKTNSVERARITSSGNFGIGTTSPGFVLHAIWNLGGNINPIAVIETTGAGSAASMRFKNAASHSYAMGILSSGEFAISSFDNNVSSSDAFRISSTSNVGIGASAPVSKLDVNGDLHLAQMTAPSPVTDKLYNVGGSLFWNGTNISSGGGSGWALTGNAGTVDATNFIGTSDLNPFNIRVNNTSSGRIDPTLLNTFFGYQSGNISTTGANNTGMGFLSLNANVGGDDNVAIGYGSMKSNKDGGGNVAIGRGSLFSIGLANGGTSYGTYNTAVGYQALYQTNPSATTNGYHNTAIGFNAGQANTTGTSNTFLGDAADASTGNLSNATAIGANAVVGASNSLVLGGTGANAVSVGIGTSTPFSSLHIKGNGLFSSFLSLEHNTRWSIGINGDDLLFVKGSGLTFTPLQLSATGDVDFTGTAGNTRMHITDAGNVGIGTSTPNALLQLSNALGNRKLVLYDVNNNDHQYYGFGVNGGEFRYQIPNNAGAAHKFYAGTSATTSLLQMTIGASGNVAITGSLSKGSGTFKIDHPQDPENKYLYHSFVESPDMMNVYNGNITTEANGEAIVNLPEYFESLNKDFRYQLTVIGDFAQAIVYKKIANNKFVIKTDKPNIEVSWQVTGIRKDPFAEKNRVVPEVMKSPEEKGKYLHPEAYGLSPEKGIGSKPNH